MALTLSDALDLVVKVGELVREHPPTPEQRATLVVLNELFRRTGMAPDEYLAEIRLVLGVS